ncbi:MAG: aminotransferase class I/II-fold pyridoxal phosphate-dependent enzyme [Salibacteraceae bacterium]
MSWIPLHEPSITEAEETAVLQTMQSGWLSTAGPAVNQFEVDLAERIQVDFAVACNSGTSALHMALLAEGVRENDLVIAPDITFVATINAIRYVGASPVFIDVDPETWQLDLPLLEYWLEHNTELNNRGELIKKDSKSRVAALIMVDVMGSIADVDEAKRIAKKFHLPIIEDAAEALGSTYNAIPAGGLFDSGIISFNGNKIITCGAGGVYLTNDERKAERVRHLSTTSKTDGYRFIHDEIGYNYRMVNILATVGCAQLSRLDKILKQKQNIYDQYVQHLDAQSVGLQRHNGLVKWNNWLITITVNNPDSIHEALLSEGIDSRTIWAPMHDLHMNDGYAFITEANVSKSLWKRTLSLPSSPNLQDHTIAQICDIVNRQAL